MNNPILQGKVCPYCNSETQFVDSSTYYSNGVSYGMIYICRPCDAIVGVHKGTDKALGRLANRALREMKKAAHASFDQIWKNNHMSRSEAYKWLSQELDIPSEETHIGMFSEDICQKVIDLTSKYLQGK